MITDCFLGYEKLFTASRQVKKTLEEVYNCHQWKYRGFTNHWLYSKTGRSGFALKYLKEPYKLLICNKVKLYQNDGKRKRENHDDEGKSS